jgi:Ca-activated chloride channel family protein
VNAVTQKVRLNSIIVGAEAPELKLAAFTTNGIYIAGAKDRLENFFTKEFFAKVNTNIKWIVLWLGAAWIALMWTLTLPLDRWIFQGLMRLEMPLAGQLSLGNALFWSVLTPILIWQILKLLDLPFFSAC